MQPNTSCRRHTVGRAMSVVGVLVALHLAARIEIHGVAFSLGMSTRSARGKHAATMPSGQAQTRQPWCRQSGSHSACGPAYMHRRAATVDVTAVEAPHASSAGTAEDEHLVKLKEFARQGLSTDAEDLLYDIIDAGGKPQAAHYNTVIDSCAPEQDIERAERWLFRMQALEVKPTIGTYNALIRIAAAASNTQLAEAWFKEAYEAELNADLGTYQALLEAHRQAGDVARIETWFEHMMLADVKPDINCCNSIIATFAAAGKMKKVEEWLAITEHSLKIPPNAESYNFAIAGHLSASDISTAEQLMEHMAERGVQPNAESFALLIGDGTSYRELSTVKLWSQRLLEAGVELAPETYTAVIGAFSGAGDAARAEDWFSRMVDEGKQTAEALALLVDALVLSGGEENLDTAQDWVDQFRASGAALTPAVYAALASADVLRGDFEQVEARLQQMDADGLEMDERSLTALLLSYANAVPQQSQLAEQMFKQQMLQGRLEATRDVLEALRAAVGGARCLALRRELQLGQPPAVENKNARKRLTKAGLEMIGLGAMAEETPVLSWE